jgi:hypothetical protein
VRGLIAPVTVVVDDTAPEGIWLEIKGDLAQLLCFSEGAHQKAPGASAISAV